ncbi:MAG: transposase [Fimbriimonadales bacterium]
MSKQPLYYTFGNHMHWVDMEWLWGYHVLPGSVRDMLHYCRETGAKGNVNFDGIGYEKLAAESPEALAELREAVQAGTIEPVGCSYGQPYGLFHGGESNVRQRVYGARAVRRLLGVWPQTFWEEEFDFFPQLPQILKGCGFKYASLFFQWTWHTPEIPKEDAPAVWWEAPDGSRLLAATRNALNLHQWPEDVDTMLADLDRMEPGETTPLIQQWLELMPSKDWMCRSEVLLPRMKALLADERFEIQCVTLGEYLSQCGTGVPPVVSMAVPAMEGEVETRRGAYLPHWRREGATYAVTFRLADSLPIEVQRAYREERQRLDELFKSKQLDSKAVQESYRQLYLEKVEGTLNQGFGTCRLRESATAQLVMEALRHFDGNRYHLHACCVMPNHVHAVVQPAPGQDLSNILHSWKSFTAHAMGGGDVWQSEYYDHVVRGPGDLVSQVRYVAENPGKAGLTDWPWVYVADDSHGRDGHGDHGRDARATLALPVRRYSMDDVWHGMTLGKNGDRIRHYSRDSEEMLTSWEAGFACASMLGRPYPQWDIYPAWELEEGWRKLLRSQHHDNDECEGLCAHVAYADYAWLDQLESNFYHRLQRYCRTFPEADACFNPNGWPAHGLPSLAFGPRPQEPGGVEWKVEATSAHATTDKLSVVVDLQTGTITYLASPDFPDGALREPLVLLPIASEHIVVEDLSWEGSSSSGLVIRAKVNHESYVCCVTLTDEGDGLRLSSSVTQQSSDNKGGFAGSYRLGLVPNLDNLRIRTDTPYSVVEVEGRSRGVRKYPEGDWMTSAQWFEEVSGAFCGLSFVDFSDDVRGLLICQASPTQWFRREDTMEMVVGAVDPWDEGAIREDHDKVCVIIPHGRMRASECWRRANTKKPFFLAWTPPPFSAVRCSSDNVVLTGFYRETEDYSGMHLENYAGAGMGYPFVVRLVEFDGLDTRAEIHVAGEVAKAYKTNLLGQIETELEVIVETGEAGHPHTGRSSLLRVPMRGNEIATLYLDIVEGRKVARDLDAKREVWAQVHRHEEAT